MYLNLIVCLTIGTTVLSTSCCFSLCSFSKFVLPSFIQLVSRGLEHGRSIP